MFAYEFAFVLECLGVSCLRLSLCVCDGACNRMFYVCFCCVHGRIRVCLRSCLHVVSRVCISVFAFAFVFVCLLVLVCDSTRVYSYSCLCSLFLFACLCLRLCLCL